MLNGKGSYLGTEINEQWWRRYMKDGLFARGAGEYWCDRSGFFFRRYLTRKPMVFHFDKMLAVKTGHWHAGRWAGGPVLIKLIWKHDGDRLSSGFLLSRNVDEVEAMVGEFNRYINDKR